MKEYETYKGLKNLITVKIPLWCISSDGDPENGEKIFEVSVKG